MKARFPSSKRLTYLCFLLRLRLVEQAFSDCDRLNLSRETRELLGISVCAGKLNRENRWQSIQASGGGCLPEGFGFWKKRGNLFNYLSSGIRHRESDGCGS